jgi:HEAT repeat protein
MKKSVCSVVLLAILLPLGCVGNQPHYRGKSLKHWIRQLADKDADFRKEAAKALGFMGADGKSAIPSLGRALYDPELDVRCAAASALLKIGLTDKQRSAMLLELVHRDMKGEDPEARRKALLLLANLQPGEHWVPPLVQFIKSDQSSGVRNSAAVALANVEAEAVPPLLALLDDSDAETRMFAALSLSIVAKDGVKEALVAVPKLKALLQDEDKNVRTWASAALQQFKVTD